jgi:membrane fusion protein, multidrug efflux system
MKPFESLSFTHDVDFMSEDSANQTREGGTYDDVEENNGAAAPTNPATRHRLVISLVVVAVITGAAVFGYRYWTVGRFMESTDDAYLKADYSTIAPKVSGYVAEVAVNDNEHVAAGQLLIRIDDRDFRAALEHAKAEVDAAGAAISNLDAQRTLQQSIIRQKQASIEAQLAALHLAQDDDARYRQLINAGAVAVQQAQQAATVLKQSQANLQEDQAALVAARKQIDVLNTARTQADARHASAQAALRQAELNLSYTSVVAPLDGTVGARSVRIGQFVQAGTQLMAVVPLEGVYVVANFKETQLDRVRAGQPVTITVDAFPNAELSGRVDSLSPASGLEFSLLPPDNATGNFTKIVQRIPVKIVFDSNTSTALLRSGMSVEPTIDTRIAPAAASFDRVASSDGARVD